MKFVTSTYHLFLAFIIIGATGFIIFRDFPLKDNYRTMADEGSYYRQGKVMVTEGWAGFDDIANTYINTPELHDTPHPLRIGANVLSAICIFVKDTYHSLSFLSLLSYLAMLTVAFIFFQHYYSKRLALLIMLLLAISPINMAMARRALMDQPSNALCVMAILSFIHSLQSSNKLFAALSILMLAFAILIKETSVLLLPFFMVAAIIYKFNRNTTLSWPWLIALFTAPAIIVGAVYLTVYGWHTTYQIVHILTKPSTYSAVYGQGPWHKYLLDYLLLSPFVFLLALFYCGYMIVVRDARPHEWLLFALSIYLVVVYSFLSKNVRYFLLFDFPLRLFAAYMLWTVLKASRYLKWATILLLVLMVYKDEQTFDNYFVINDVYDPVTQQLFSVEGIIPKDENQ